MNKPEQELFTAFFEELYETEQLLDYIKSQLRRSKGFHPHALFDMIANGQQNITPSIMRRYLEERVSCTQRDLYEIFEKFDWSRQGAISKEDFAHELSPFQGQRSRLADGQGLVTAEIQGHFSSLILEIIKRLKIVEVGRRQIRSIPPYDAFKQIDKFKKGIISISSLRTFFQDNQFAATQQQLYYLLHALRRRAYADVNLQVFCETLNPLQFGYYSGYQQQLQSQIQACELRRSRVTQQGLRRSRLELQMAEHQLLKAERRKKAQIDRSLDLQDKATAEIIAQDQSREFVARQALIQQDNRLRASRQVLLEQQNSRLLREKMQRQYLRQLRERQQATFAISASRLARQRQLQESRRILERQQRLLNAQSQDRLLKQAQLIKETALKRRLQIEERLKLDQQAIRLRVKENQLSRLRNSRRFADQNAYSPIDRSRDFYKELQMEKLRARAQLRELGLADQYEKELELTRLELQERRSRLLLAQSPYS